MEPPGLAVPRHCAGFPAHARCRRPGFTASRLFSRLPVRKRAGPQEHPALQGDAALSGGERQRRDAADHRAGAGGSRELLFRAVGVQPHGSDRLKVRLVKSG